MDQYLAFLAGLGQDTQDFDDDHLLDIIEKCPICSKKSNNVIPNRFWSGDPRTKEIYLGEYKKNFEMKKCPYEVFESGLWWPFSKSTSKFCPFPNCTYRHKYQRLQERFSWLDRCWYQMLETVNVCDNFGEKCREYQVRFAQILIIKIMLTDIHGIIIIMS